MPGDRELASVVYRYAIAHPERHDQFSYFGENECGTTACLAGMVWEVAGDGDPLPDDPASYALAKLGLDVTLEKEGFVDAATGRLLVTVFLEMHAALALRRFAAFFGLDPETGDLLGAAEPALVST